MPLLILGADLRGYPEARIPEITTEPRFGLIYKSTPSSRHGLLQALISSRPPLAGRGMSLGGTAPQRFHPFRCRLIQNAPGVCVFDACNWRRLLSFEPPGTSSDQQFQGHQPYKLP
jgi:hypothetical protein